MLVESFSGSPPAKRLAWASVQRKRDSVQGFTAMPMKIGAFGEVLAQEPVGVLVRSALPRAVRIAEVDRQPGIEMELRVLRHLGALVPGERSTKLFG